MYYDVITNVRAGNTIECVGTWYFNQSWVFFSLFDPKVWKAKLELRVIMFIVRKVGIFKLLKLILQSRNGTPCKTGNNCTHAIFRLFSKSGRVIFL